MWAGHVYLVIQGLTKNDMGGGVSGIYQGKLSSVTQG